jgi:hypothetical protein
MCKWSFAHSGEDVCFILPHCAAAAAAAVLVLLLLLL